MKAIVVRQPGPPENLVLADVPDPVPGPGEVLVRVAATALNRADLLQRRGVYPPPPGVTEVLGLECSGTVVGRGPGAELLREGDRVMALLPGGGYAELVAVPERLAVPLPAALSFERAAAIPEAFLTAREALFTLGQLGEMETVLVHAAAGGVGSAAVQLAVQHGATVFATCSGGAKAALVRELGAALVVDYKSEDFAARVHEFTGGRGVDVIVDLVGAAYWEKHAALLADDGRIVIVGLLGGARASVDLSRVLMRRHRILGLVMRTRSLADKVAITQRFVRHTLPLFEGETPRLEPVIHGVYPLARAAEAHALMEQNANVGKIVLTVP
jgi:putative PIG3 family NAD(P)H quinone oxidoreductase